MDVYAYSKKRQIFYQGIERFWHDLYGEEYALYDIKAVNTDEIADIRLAGDRIGHIFFKVCKLLRKVSDETLAEMGFPTESFPVLRQKTLSTESVISRLDLIPVGDGYKCIEINADTPTFIKELFSVNGLMCREYKMGDPNAGMEAKLAEAVRSSVFESARHLREPKPYIVFTAHEDHVEDRETVTYLQNISRLPSRFVPLHKLQIEEGKGLYDEYCTKIDILYRQTFPVENLILDEDESGNPIGKWLLDLVALKKVAIINPPSAFLLQNKAVQAVIWGLHVERHPMFTPEEHSWIESYFLPTYLEADAFKQQNLSYVKKPAFGREGDTVEIYDENGILLKADPQQNYGQYLAVYQQYAELPRVEFMSEKGKQAGQLLIGCFLLNGRAAAFGYRAGGKITNNLSYYLPAGIKRDSRRGELDVDFT
ncbi:glutathionylspermidine synthase family protein [Mesobacillus foraminis]|uniref:glutathionylspermidine synthase family protein n=1 Tax=Mesobacillus foraminis TaxID=279826 RepID=UPI001BEAB004|nr:glutathionylspermidine synthase family protein [Mesobacillus foraminis]MBT2755418.1 glutathionylspermidine synthase family protein [Mesobacillus foraminis]